MKQRNKMRIRDMTHDYWIYFWGKNYVQKDLENEKNRLIIDGKTSNDGDASTNRKILKNCWRIRMCT